MAIIKANRNVQRVQDQVIGRLPENQVEPVRPQLRNTRITAEQHGYGEGVALGKAAKVVDDIGDTVTDIVGNIITSRNNAEYNNLSTSYQQELNKVLYGDGDSIKGVLNERGLNLSNQSPVIQKAINELQQKYSDDAGNNAIRNKFLEYSDKKNTIAFNEVNKHIYNEISRGEIESIKASINENVKDVGLNYTPGNYDANKKEVIKNVDELGKKLGLSEEQLKQVKNEHITRLIKSATATALENGDLASAYAIVQSSRDNLLPKARAEISKELNKQSLQIWTQEKADELIQNNTDENGEPNWEDIYATARGKEHAKNEVSLVKEIRQRQLDYNRSKVRENKELSRSAMAKVTGNNALARLKGGVTDGKVVRWEDLTVQEQFAIESTPGLLSRAKHILENRRDDGTYRNIVDDRTKYNQINTIKESDPETFANTNLNSFEINGENVDLELFLTPKTFSSLKEDQAKLRQNPVDTRNASAGIYNAISQIAAISKAYGINTKDLSNNETMEFVSDFSRQYNKLTQDGNRLSKNETIELAQSLFSATKASRLFGLTTKEQEYWKNDNPVGMEAEYYIENEAAHLTNIQRELGIDEQLAAEIKSDMINSFGDNEPPSTQFIKMRLLDMLEGTRLQGNIRAALQVFQRNKLTGKEPFAHIDAEG